ncbi:MAG: hypothetical protein IKK58_02610 [Clostridia bacterium]|nr:hypothetical protein [Clostridia bacterium]
MFKKAIKYIGYGFCGFNMGMTSALTPVIFLPALLIAGIDKMGNYNLPIPMLITVIICVIAAVAYYATHYLKAKRNNDSPDPRATATVLGFVIGAVVMGVICAVLLSDDGTGYV